MADAPVVTAPAAAPAAASALVTPGTPGTPPASHSPAAPPEYFEVKVDGKVERMTREEVLRNASLGKGANKRFEESSAKEKRAEALLSRVRDPKEALKLLQDPEMGLSKEQIRGAIEEWYEENVIGPSQMTPEQLELSESKKRLKAYEEREKADKERVEREENEQLDQAEAQRLQVQVLEQVEKSGLPKTKFTASRLAYWMRINQTKGINAPAELLVEQVRGEARGIMESMIQKSDGDVLINLLGEDTVKKIRRYDLERIRSKRGLKNPEPEIKPDTQRKERIDESDVRRRMREL